MQAIDRTKQAASAGWTFALVSAALLMVVLDNLVVTTALPVLRVDLGATIQGLEWTVNGYTLTYAVLLLTGAALGDRFGRRRMFLAGLALFVAGSAAAALAPSIGALIAARVAQGAGAAVVTPLTLTLLSEVVPEGRRGLAIGAWSGISGLGIALGPLVGGAVVEGLSWHWIFWINVPIGLVVLPLAWRKLGESRGPGGRLDRAGVALASAGLLGIVYGVVRAQSHGWASGEVLAALAGGTLVLGAFLLWQRRAPAPMLPLRFFKQRAFAATSGVSFAMFFGIFGAIFLLAQFFQTAQGYSPLEAGLRTLPWTAMPMVVAPLAGALSDRIGARPLMALGLALQAGALAWLAVESTPSVAYGALVPGLVMGGVGMGLVFAPAANAILGAVRPSETGKASGAMNAIRELGGVFGVAVLATVFTGAGGYRSPLDFTDGLGAALWVAVGVLAIGALAALAVPRAAARAGGGSGDPAGEPAGEPSAERAEARAISATA